MERAFAEDEGLATGLNVRGGELIHPAVIQAFRDGAGPPR
jgi:alanine dehydrogenase